MLSYEDVEAREARRRVMDQKNWDEVTAQIKAMKPEPLSAENQKVISAEQFQKLEASGLTQNLGRFITQAEARKKQAQQRREAALARQAEMKKEASC